MMVCASFPLSLHDEEGRTVRHGVNLSSGSNYLSACGARSLVSVQTQEAEKDSSHRGG